MKKKLLTLAITLLTAVPMLAGCEEKDPYVESRTEEELITELSEIALDQIGSIYSSFSSDGIALGTTELTKEAIVTIPEWEKDTKGLKFSFTYSIANKMEKYDEEFLKLDAENYKLTANFVTALDLVKYPSSAAVNAAVYSLEAKVKFEGYAEDFVAPNGLTTSEEFVGKEMSSKKYTTLVKETKSGTMQECKEAAAKSYVLFYGQVAGYFNSSKDEMYTGVFVTNGNDGIMIYAGNITTAVFGEGDEAQIKMGDYVMVYGEVSPYNGLYEVKPKTFKVIDDQNIIKDIKPFEYNEYTAKELMATGMLDTGRMATIKGCTLVSNVAPMSSGDHNTIKMKDANGDEFICYMNYHFENGKSALDFLKGLTAGETFDVYGVVSQYNGAQISPLVLSDGQAPFVKSVA